MITVKLRGTEIKATGKALDAALRALGRRLGYSRSKIDRFWYGGLNVLGDGLYMITLALSPTEHERRRGNTASSVIGEVIVSEE